MARVSGSNRPWKPELTNVAKLGDELWVGVICQTNSEIACSPRNNFRVSVTCSVPEVEHWMGKGAYSLPNSTKLRMPVLQSVAVGLREMSFVVERETAQIIG